MCSSDLRNGSGTSSTIYAYQNTGSYTLKIGVGATDDSSSGTLIPNAWNHIALVRNGSSIYVYLNGVQTNTFTDSTNFSSSTGVYIGSRYSVQQYGIGYVADLRVVKGSSVYPSGTTFTPPTTALTAITNTTFLLNSNRIVDTSTNNATPTIYGSKDRKSTRLNSSH